MPRLPINYENACIYEIVCKDVNITQRYIGSTTNLIKRRYAHKSNCNNENCNHYNQYVYQFIRANGGIVNWDVVLIEKVIDCKDKEHLHKRERFHVESLKAELNKQIPLRTQKEYDVDNREKKKEYRANNKNKIAEKRKIYYEENKEKYNEYQREYRANNKDKYKECRKEYCENNKNKLAEKRKIYYEENKEKYNEYREENKDKQKAYQKAYRANKKNLN
jgi:hypothetical protein